jgi:hypothetical protein
MGSLTLGSPLEIRGVKGASFYSTTISGGGSAPALIRSPRSCGAVRDSSSRVLSSLTILGRGNVTVYYLGEDSRGSFPKIRVRSRLAAQV